jgi:hypothetical protein
LTGLAPLGGLDAWVEGPAKQLLPLGVRNALWEPNGPCVGVTSSSPSIIMGPRGLSAVIVVAREGPRVVSSHKFPLSELALCHGGLQVRVPPL